MCEAEPRVSVHPDLISKVDRAQRLCAGEMSPHQCEDLRGGKVMPTSQPLGAIPACHQGMGRDREAGTQRQEG